MTFPNPPLETQVQQQRPESPTVTFTWHACKYKVHKLHKRYILKFRVIVDSFGYSGDGQMVMEMHTEYFEVMIQTRKRFKRTLIFNGASRNVKIFRGQPPFQSDKLPVKG